MHEPSTPRPRAGPTARWLAALGLAALALWAAWWVKSACQDRLAYGRHTWVPILPFLGGDFRVHIDHVSRVWAAGRDYYLDPCDWICTQQPFGPMVPRLFGWVQFVETKTATRLWIAALGAIAVVAGAAVARSRRGNGLKSLPWPCLAALLTFSTPFVTAMERAQVDPIMLPALLAAGVLLNARNARGAAELAAGAILSTFAWIKYYPALTLLGLVALRRWRAAIAFAAVGGAIGLIDAPRIRQALTDASKLAQDGGDLNAHTHPVQHAIGKFWPRLWARTPWPSVGRVPGPLVSGFLLGPALVLVARRVGASPARDRLAGPLLVWITAAGTFALPYSNDYNLVFLPVAVLATWSARDPWPVHLALLALLPWWQPFALPIDGPPLFLAKLAALYASGVCLTRRAREASPAPHEPRRAAIPRPKYRTTRPIPSEP
jgi:hypothetical protein